MSFEGAPNPNEGVFYDDGSINAEFVAEHYGLGIEEAAQEIQFGSHQGTVAQMLADEGCPVGDRIATAYQEEGIEGVARVYEGIKVMDPKFEGKISEDTFERERKKQAEIAKLEAIPVEQERSKEPDDTENPQANSQNEIESSAARAPRSTLMEEETMLRQREAELLDHSKSQAKEEPFIETEEAGQAEEEQVPADVETNMVADETPKAIKTATFEDRIGKTEETPAERIVVPTVPITETTRSTERNEAQVALAAQDHESDETIALEQSLGERVVEPTLLPMVEDVVRRSYNIEPEENIIVAEPLMVAEEAREAEAIETVHEMDVAPPILDEPETMHQKSVQEFTETIQLITEEKLWDGEVDTEIIELMSPAAVELSRQINEALQAPEAIDSESVQAVVAEVAQAVENIELLEASGEDTEEAEQKLMVACEKLLDELDISYEEESIEQFAKVIVVARKTQLAPGKEEIAEAVIYDEGTHEFKPGNLGLPGLILGAGQKLKPLRVLGQWALASSLA